MTVKIHEIVEDYEPMVLYSKKASIYEREVEVKEMKNPGYPGYQKVLETAPLTDDVLGTLTRLSYEMINPNGYDYITVTMAILRTLFPDNEITIEHDENLNEYFTIEDSPGDAV